MIAVNMQGSTLKKSDKDAETLERVEQALHRKLSEWWDLSETPEYTPILAQVAFNAMKRARSQESHGHYFAVLGNLWDNLPEEKPWPWLDSEHMRKFALIKCGYCEMRQFAMKSEAEARSIAFYIAAMDNYALIVPNGKIITIYTAASQSKAAMGFEEFQTSKTKVLDYLCGLIGVSREEAETQREKDR